MILYNALIVRILMQSRVIREDVNVSQGFMIQIVLQILIVNHVKSCVVHVQMKLNVIVVFIQRMKLLIRIVYVLKIQQEEKGIVADVIKVTRNILLI
mmetsp:Transcript_6476/g.827  ORF Transcript_6476/g.827 Transcript_6476/m.827 type:complete len:97 (-) Transcript_6476:12-302(-)